MFLQRFLKAFLTPHYLNHKAFYLITQTLLFLLLKMN
nr:MAG TPA: hypothetical protein [Caudoviricetes sp.]